MYLCILTQATIKCAFLRDKKVILLLILSGNPNLFLDLKKYHSLEHAATKKLIFLFILLRKMNGLVSTTFTLEQNSGFKLERNKDLTFIVIIIDIDWYEKNYRDNFFGHIAQP